ncbi:MAG: T9SS type A sorting domain-containing protein, partial [candidate division WOR-3 bacterium]
VHWIVFDITNPSQDTLFETSTNCYTSYNATQDFATWYADVGNFPTAWSAGDSLIAFGSWDSVYAAYPGSYGDSTTHTGFYWLFSDTLTTQDPQNWLPADTLRPLPKPIVYKIAGGPGAGANDTIVIQIPNPKETRGSGQTVYDVLGFWIWADSTGTGTPDAYDDAGAIEIAMVSVQGGQGDTTEFRMLESDSFLPWDAYSVWFVYKLVVRPDFSRGSGGWASSYYSQNPDSAITVYQHVIGIDEHEAEPLETGFQKAAPNPFCTNTCMTFSLRKETDVEIVLYNAAGQRVKAIIDRILGPGVHTVTFDGHDEKGVILPAGVYLYRFRIGETTEYGRLVKL